MISFFTERRSVMGLLAATLLYGAVFVGMVYSDKALYAISRLYEGFFVYWQYDYYGIWEERWHKELSFHKKYVCNKEDYTPEMAAFLHQKLEEPTKVLSHRGRKRTYLISLSGKKYVVKSHRQHGFWKNLLQMGKGITIWNNCMWAEKKGLPVEEAVAFIETRRLGSVTTAVLYRYEGEGVNYAIQKNGDLAHLVDAAILLLENQNVIHQDLRARNMIYVKEEKIKFIDIDILHYYPFHSFVYNRRMAIERKLFVEDCPDYARYQEMSLSKK